MKNTFVLLIATMLLQSSIYSQLHTIDRFGKASRITTKESIHVKVKVDSSEYVKIEEAPKLTINNKQQAVIIVKKFYPPLRKMIPTSQFGWRKHPVTGEHKFHTGVDLKAYYEPVYSIADGIVSFAGYGDIEGNYVIINHGEVSSVYCHLSKILFSTNQIIKAGELLGISGNTGRSTGPHLHFGVRWKSERLNPIELFKIFPTHPKDR